MASTDTAAARETVLAELELSRRVAVQLTIVGTMGFAVAFAAFSALYRIGTGRAATYAFAPAGAAWWNEALDLLVVLALATAIAVPHEWLHGLAIRRYGGEPRYGVGVAHFVLPYAYATTDHRFTRDQFLVVLVTPLVVLTLVGVPAMIAFEWGWLVVPLAANAGGAVGDLWMALTLLAYPPHVDVEDDRTGSRVLGREGDRPRDPSVTAAVWDALVGAAVATVGILVVLGFGGMYLLASLGVETFAIGSPGGDVPVRVHQHADGDLDQRRLRRADPRRTGGSDLRVRADLPAPRKSPRRSGGVTRPSRSGGLTTAWDRRAAPRRNAGRPATFCPMAR